ncbi:hypothetical protein D9615_003338 [Tricholomella constricta]|uniref:Conidiation-specific protein 6 n=1 Tax=Tricholomella constricta TaxID=117010 RepID=A0A8H5HJP4_9AGAR|nr:hypothetical protein D9615_003338 [Tricholomella constricta]
MAPSEEHAKNPERVAAGLKATIKNPKVSEEAKAHATERLQELGGGETSKEKPTTQHATHDVESNRVLGGYKATLHNEKTSEDAKNHAREILSAAGYHEYETDEKEHNVRVIAGYKAALHNPKVSEEAKQHAKEYLKDHDAL